MSFLKLLTHNKPYIKHKKYLKRKEQNSLLANHFFLQNVQIESERASAFTSKGSLTLEAAIVVPMFFFAVLSLLCVFEMMGTKMTIRQALGSAARQISQQSYSLPGISVLGLREQIVGFAGKERLEKSPLQGGSKGLDCSRTTYDRESAVYDLSVRYRMEVPILFFQLPVVSCEEKLRVKGWTGMAGGSQAENGDTTVYITKEGSVYHKDMFCTYLVASVHTTTWEELESLRNESGGRYYACEVCANRADQTGRVYVTDYGDRYHVFLGCSTLKRVVYAVPYHEVIGRGGCSKCVK